METIMRASRRTFTFGALLGLLLAGCSTPTTLRSAWYDSSFTGGPMKRLLVVGVAGNITDRRVFEDQFAKALNDVGVQGIPGYQFIDNAPTASAEAFDAGVTKSGADGLLLVRLLGVDTRTQVTTTMVPARSAPTFGPRGPWAPAWGPVWYTVPDIRQFQVANVEATLFEVRDHQPIWSATTETLNPTSVAAETPGLAKLIIGQLSARGLIAPTK
jgi:hypothetical protein